MKIQRIRWSPLSSRVLGKFIVPSPLSPDLRLYKSWINTAAPARAFICFISTPTERPDYICLPDWMREYVTISPWCDGLSASSYVYSYTPSEMLVEVCNLGLSSEGIKDRFLAMMACS